MAQLEKMSAKQLDSWINKLEKSIKDEDNERNIDLYRRWLIQAREEKTARWERKENYLNNRKN